MNNYKEFFECKIIDGDVPYSKQMQIKQIKPFDFSQAQLENPILNAAIETLDKQIYKKIGIEYDAMILKDALRKAKIYDNLSNELGCPLEIVFKALKEGLIIETYDDELDVTIIDTFKPDELVLDFIAKSIITGEEYIDYVFPLENYGKTWWLKSDKECE